MKNVSEPNAQNSEIRPEAHPSGARIEKMMKKAKDAGNADRINHEAPLNPSDAPAEGSRDIDTKTHRKTPTTRQ